MRRTARAFCCLGALCLLTGAGCSSGLPGEVPPGGPRAAPHPSPRLLASRLRGVNISERGSRRYREADFATLRSWGATAVRLLVTYGQVISKDPPHRLIPSDLDRIDKLLAWSEQNGLFLVLTLHELPGYLYVAGDDNRLWSNPPQRQLVLDFWRAVATRYRDRGDVIAYDLLNEPHGTGGQWLPLARRATAAIRSIDRRHTIVVEADEWSWPEGFSSLQPTGDPNTVYSPHIYLPQSLTTGSGHDPYPGPFAHRGRTATWDRDAYARAYDPVVAFQRRHRVPIWVGEFGCVRWRPGLTRWLADQVELFETNGWGWAWYAYREWPGMDLELSTDVQDQRRPPREPAHLTLFRSLLRADARRRLP